MRHTRPIPAHRISAALEARAAHLRRYNTDETFSAQEVRDLLAAETAALIAAHTGATMAEIRLFASTLLLKGDADDSADYYRTHKIQAIKQVRNATNCGLKEAKDAVEAALPTALREVAKQALKALAEANSRAQFIDTAYLSTADLGNAFSG